MLLYWPLPLTNSTNAGLPLVYSATSGLDQSLSELTLPLQPLSGPIPTTEMIRTHTPTLQRFVLMLYGVSEDNMTTVDAAQLALFFHKGKDFDHMPLSSDALHQHLLQVAYQVRQLCIGA